MRKQIFSDILARPIRTLPVGDNSDWWWDVVF